MNTLVELAKLNGFLAFAVALIALFALKAFLKAIVVVVRGYDRRNDVLTICDETSPDPEDDEAHADE